MATWQPKLIPRKTLGGRRQTQTVDEFGIPTTSAPVLFDIENAGVQPVSGHEMNTMPEGYRDRKMYKVFTTTPVFTAVEGSDNLADKIETVSGVWCDVVRVQAWSYGIQSHYEAYVAQENER